MTTLAQLIIEFLHFSPFASLVRQRRTQVSSGLLVFNDSALLDSYIATRLRWVYYALEKAQPVVEPELLALEVL